MHFKFFKRIGRFRYNINLFMGGIIEYKYNVYREGTKKNRCWIILHPSPSPIASVSPWCLYVFHLGYLNVMMECMG